MSIRKEKPKTRTHKVLVLKVTHVRRCHVCGTVNESEGSANMKCHECGKHLAPFYYFDESKLEGLSEVGPYLSQYKSAPDFNPIYGFSHYWVDEIEEEISEAIPPATKEETSNDSKNDSHTRRHQKGKRSTSKRDSRNRN